MWCHRFISALRFILFLSTVNFVNYDFLWLDVNLPTYNELAHRNPNLLWHFTSQFGPLVEQFNQPCAKLKFRRRQHSLNATSCSHNPTKLDTPDSPHQHPLTQYYPLRFIFRAKNSSEVWARRITNKRLVRLIENISEEKNTPTRDMSGWQY